MCICDVVDGDHPYCPVHHPETIGKPMTELVTLLGGPRNGDIELVAVDDNHIYVHHYPDMASSMKMLKGFYYRVPVNVMVWGMVPLPSGPVFLWQLEADTTK